MLNGKTSDTNPSGSRITVTGRITQNRQFRIVRFAKVLLFCIVIRISGR
jgi:hypothetical protein